MAQKSLLLRLGNNIVEEAQLLAEKKWILEALAKIKNQRNCLQIERLHLESLKGQMKTNSKQSVEVINEGTNVPSTSALNLMQSAPKCTEFDFSDASVMNDEIVCNEQELDLIISDCIFKGNGDTMSCNMEEDEEQDDDIMIDMNMLMNGDSK